MTRYELFDIIRLYAADAAAAESIVTDGDIILFDDDYFSFTIAATINAAFLLSIRATRCPRMYTVQEVTPL